MVARHKERDVTLGLGSQPAKSPALLRCAQEGSDGIKATRLSPQHSVDVMEGAAVLLAVP